MQEKPDFWDDKEPAPEKPDWVYAWFAERKIGARVVDEFGITAARWIFDPKIGEVDAVALPLTSKGQQVNRVLRPRKGDGSAMENKAVGVFGAAAFTDGGALVWCRSELDVLALAECGLTGGVWASRVDAMAHHADLISKTCRVTLACGTDPAGIAQREEMARRFGRHRCWITQFSPWAIFGVDGPESVLQVIQDAVPYPIEGMHKIQMGTLAKLRSMPAPSVMTTGTSASDEVIKLPTEGRLIVITGFPNHGKTTWTRFMMVHTATRHNRRWVVFSPESQPWEQFAAECAEAYIGKPFYELERVPGMTDEDIREAERFLSDKITMLVCDTEEVAPSLDWLLERGAASVLRDGTTDFLFDPWNEVDQARGDMSETDFIGRSLQRLRAFAQRYGCNVWVVAHPSKPAPIRPKEVRPPPGPYDISGSAHWVNKPDIGLTVHNPAEGVTELHVWKSKSRRWGARGRKATMEFDRLCGVYSTPSVSNQGVPSQDSLDRGEWGV